MPIDADREAASRARMNKAVTSAWLLGVALAGGTSACTRSGVAAGLDQDTAPKVTLGMSSEAVLGALGAPLTDTYDPPDKATRRLVYARVGVLSLGSNHLMWPGLDYTVLLQDGAVVSAYILDTKRDLMCRCERERCLPDWTVPCLVSLPVPRDTEG